MNGFEADLADFAQVASFVLALLTIFTSSRGTAIEQLNAHGVKPRSATREMWLVVVVFLGSLGVLVSGVPLWIEAFSHACFAVEGALPLAFLFAWPITVGLLVWQAALWERARDLRSVLRDNT